MSAHDDTVAANLSRLRAHAALLVGTRTTADSCVWVVLEAVQANPGLLRSEHGCRLGLLRLLHRVSVGLLAPLPGARTVDDPLAGLTTEERQAVLLLDVERLSPQAAAFVVGRGPGSLVIALASAHRRLNDTSRPAPADPPRRSTAEATLQARQ